MLADKSIYWTNMKTDIEEAIKSCPSCLDYQAKWPKDKVMSHEIWGRPLESVRADIFTVNSKCYHCILDNHSKFPVGKQVMGFSTDNLIKKLKIFRILAAQQHSFRWRKKLYFRTVWNLLQKAWHSTCSITIIQ